MIEALIEDKELRGNKLWRWQLVKIGVDPDRPWTLRRHPDMDDAVVIEQDDRA